MIENVVSGKVRRKEYSLGEGSSLGNGRRKRVGDRKKKKDYAVAKGREEIKERET